jgi:hypothetical protein
MNREQLLEIAKREQRHMALESCIAPLDTLPTDLLTVIVDSKSESQFQLIGFFLNEGNQKTRYFRNGVEVWPAWMDTWAAFGCSGNYREIFIYDRDPCAEDSYPMAMAPYRVPMSEISREVKQTPTWCAVLTGNGVMLSYWLKNRGYKHAFNGAPAYCDVREASAEEITTYKLA